MAAAGRPGACVRAGLLAAPVAVPAGLAVAGVLWAWRIYAITTGLAGQTASAPIEFDARQWRRQARAARGRAAAPGTVPLLTRGGLVVIGRDHPRHPATAGGPVLAVPYRSFGRHAVIIGSSGSRENEPDDAAVGRLVRRRPHRALPRRDGDRPLLVVLDCKGGPDARVKAGRTRRLLHGAGARRVAIWPDEARLCLWDLPPRDLGVLLLQMIETGDGAAAYYTDVMQAVVNLAAGRARRPARRTRPVSWTGWTWPGWRPPTADGLHGAALTRIRAARPHVGDIQLRYATLLGRLGPALDGPGHAGRGGRLVLHPGRHPRDNRWPKPRPWP